MLRLLLACATVFFTFSVSAAGAAVISAADNIRSGEGKGPDRLVGTRVVVNAGAGERNVVEVSVDAAGFTVSDTGAPPTTGVGCVAVSATTVRCARRGLPGDDVYVSTGDLDDAVTVATSSTIVLGPGNDRATAFGGNATIDGNEGDDILFGGAGADWLRGGAGADELHGGAGDDSLTGGDFDAVDLLDGGPGYDFVGLEDNRQPVVVDLAANRYAEDVAVEVERVAGGFKDDILLGSDGPDLLEGAGSRHGDRIDGRGGDDIIDNEEPGPPYVRLVRHDVLIGGAGNDFIMPTRGATIDAGLGDDNIGETAASFDDSQPDGVRDVRLVCGPGRDVVNNVDAILPGDCEVVGIPYVATLTRPTLTGHTLRTTLRRTGRTCRIALRAVVGHRPISAWTPPRQVQTASGARWSIPLSRRPVTPATVELQVRTQSCIRRSYHPGFRDGRRHVRFAQIS
ncbi:MAG: hypothetical protein JWQ20_3162 [Conexibacter sp.]|nr:hypothetical protein [Conexibacter sp.]